MTSNNLLRSWQGNLIFELKGEFGVFSELTGLVFVKFFHQGSITYIDQDRSTTTLQGKQKEEVTASNKRVIASTGRALCAYQQRLNHIPGVQGSGWHVDARWWRRQQCWKRRTGAGTGAYEGRICRSTSGQEGPERGTIGDSMGSI